jgi:D-glycero-alpha-D-manno-heptose 1-phosphate guanylyltransferase
VEAIILAGGFGTRLRSLVNDRPKPMAPIGDRPFLAILLDYWARQGVSRVVLSVGYAREEIIDFFGARYGSISIAYAIEEEPLGTGGAITHALEQVSDDLVWVLNGDSFLRLDCRKMLEAHRGGGLSAPVMSLALRQIDDASRYGTVVVENERIVGFAPAGTATGGLINSGVYLMSRGIFDKEIPRVFSFERDFLPGAVERLRINGYVSDGWFIDIGVPADYARAREELPAAAGLR